MNPQPHDDLVGRCFLRDRMVVVAGPSVRKPRREPASAILLGSADADAPWRTVGPEGVQSLRLAPILRLSSMVMVHDAVRTGVGAALLPLSMIGDDIASGRLVSWGDAEGRDIELWALHLSRRLRSARVSAFLDYLGRAFPNGASAKLASFARDV